MALRPETWRVLRNRAAIGARGSKARGFSVVDLLVSIAVMTLLITILTPSLVSANEMARRAKCASNVRQLGLGLQMYAYDHADVVPPSTFSTPTTADRDGSVQDTIYVRIDSNDFDASERMHQGVKWDGLGHLASLSYADAPHVYYCPSHTGNHPYEKYRDVWLSRTGTIADNYQYRISTAGKRLGDVKGTVTLIADGMRTRPDYNHRVGNNMLKGDLSVQWFADADGALLGLLAEDETAARAPGNVNRAWNTLDNSNNQNANQ